MTNLIHELNHKLSFIETHKPTNFQEVYIKCNVYELSEFEGMFNNIEQLLNTITNEDISKFDKDEIELLENIINRLHRQNQRFAEYHRVSKRTFEKNATYLSLVSNVKNIKDSINNSVNISNNTLAEMTTNRAIYVKQLIQMKVDEYSFSNEIKYNIYNDVINNNIDKLTEFSKYDIQNEVLKACEKYIF